MIDVTVVLAQSNIMHTDDETVRLFVKCVTGLVYDTLSHQQRFMPLIRLGRFICGSAMTGQLLWVHI